VKRRELHAAGRRGSRLAACGARTADGDAGRRISWCAIHADSRVNAFIADAANRDQIVPVAGEAQNLRNLLAGVIDGFLADRIAAADERGIAMRFRRSRRKGGVTLCFADAADAGAFHEHFGGRRLGRRAIREALIQDPAAAIPGRAGS
jgi:hypothetical protein